MTMVQLKTPENPQILYPDYQDISVLLPRDFILDSGEQLSRPELRVRLFGDRGQPLVIALGGISSGRKVADSGDGRGWWRNFVGVGQPVDLNKYCVLGFDFLPNPRETARTVTTFDQARALVHTLKVLNLSSIRAFVGASYGGMVALAFAEQLPDLLEHLCVISAAEKPHPSATALRGIQRRILKFAIECGRAEEGVALARQLAMTTYRSADEFAERFESRPGPFAGEPYDVCEYLLARGGAFDVDAERYLTLSDSIDRHRVDPSKIHSETTLISSLSDQLVPPADLRRLAAAMLTPPDLHEVASRYGHDAFLKETELVGAIIKNILQGSKS